MNEFRLLTVLCLNKWTNHEKEYLQDQIDKDVNWDLIVGQSLRHKVSGYLLRGLERLNAEIMPYPVKKALQLLHKSLKRQAHEVDDIVSEISRRLNDASIQYALLKGASFNYSINNFGDRRSKDTDLMIHKDDLLTLDSVLRTMGYVQSFGSESPFIEATRQQKVAQLMFHHDLVPYVVDRPDLEIGLHRIDINFRLKPDNGDSCKEFLRDGRTQFVTKAGVTTYCLDWAHALVYLCIHFYREATEDIWTSSERDVEIYKIVDIVNHIRELPSSNSLGEVVEITKRLGFSEEVMYSFWLIRKRIQDPILEKISLLIDSSYSVSEEYLVTKSGERIVRPSLFWDDAIARTITFCRKSGDADEH